MSDAERNWAGNLRYSAARWRRPETIEEARRIVAGATRLRAVGSRHSFNAIADCDADMLSTERLNRIVALDETKRTVTIEAGVRYGELAEWLHSRGYALHNLASLPHISVAGAISTATHGSGDGNGNLATAVVGLDIIAADGSILSFDRARDSNAFNGAVVGLGALGVIATITLSVQPTFSARQQVYASVPLTLIEERFDEIMGSAYSVSLFTDWRGGAADIWLKRVGDALSVAALNGLSPATKNLHPISSLAADNCTDQCAVAGPWHLRLPHFKLGFTPSRGDELQTEYFVPRSSAIPAMKALSAIDEKLAPLLLISEVRSIAADDLWMSPCYRQDCVGFHFTWTQDWPAVERLLPQLEDALAPFEPRPHWGKLFTMDAKRVRDRYPRFEDFRALVRQLDPDGKFHNPYMESLFN